MKKLLAVALIASMSQAAFAYTGSGFKIISEKFVSNGFVDAGVKPLPPSQKKSMRSASAYARTEPAQGFVNEFIKINSTHFVAVYNPTNGPYRFTYHYTLNCGTANSYFERQVELAPDGNFMDDSYSYGTVQKSEPKMYGIMANTRINGPEKVSETHTAILTVNKR